MLSGLNDSRTCPAPAFCYSHPLAKYQVLAPWAPFNCQVDETFIYLRMRAATLLSCRSLYFINKIGMSLFLIFYFAQSQTLLSLLLSSPPELVL